MELRSFCAGFSGHSLNVDLAAHRQLLRYLQAHKADIEVAPLVEVAADIRAYRQAGGR